MQSLDLLVPQLVLALELEMQMQLEDLLQQQVLVLVMRLLDSEVKLLVPELVLVMLTA